MIINIECPECGYNKYSAICLKSNNEVTLDIGKCSDNECEITVYDMNSSLIETSQFADFKELGSFVNSNYNILMTLETNC